MLIAQLLQESKYSVLDKRISDLVSKQRESKQEESEIEFTKADATNLKVLRDIRKNDVWETSGSKVPAYGPSLSARLSANRELVLFKRTDGRIAVVQCSETNGSTTDKTLAIFANSESGYHKALDFFISRSSK